MCCDSPWRLIFDDVKFQLILGRFPQIYSHLLCFNLQAIVINAENKGLLTLSVDVPLLVLFIDDFC